ncbi:MAG: hypothetical protein ACREHD_22635 [Pirellulales bacterium]
MSCTKCGAQDHQRRIGQLWNQPDAIYHCEACDSLYIEPERDRDSGDGQPDTSDE